MSKVEILDPPPPPPLCVFCGAPWTEAMMTMQNDHADLEYGYYESVEEVSADFTIDVVCESCNRLVYRKEIRNYRVY